MCLYTTGQWERQRPVQTTPPWTPFGEGVDNGLDLDVTTESAIFRSCSEVDQENMIVTDFKDDGGTLIFTLDEIE